MTEPLPLPLSRSIMEYELHGGPFHGQRVALEEGRDHFHILAPMEQWGIAPDPEHALQPIKKKEGTYSRIAGYPGHMEWDGWTSHD